MGLAQQGKKVVEAHLFGPKKSFHTQQPVHAFVVHTQQRRSSEVGCHNKRQVDAAIVAMERDRWNHAHMEVVRSKQQKQTVVVVHEIPIEIQQGTVRATDMIHPRAPASASVQNHKVLGPGAEVDATSTSRALDLSSQAETTSDDVVHRWPAGRPDLIEIQPEKKVPEGPPSHIDRHPLDPSPARMLDLLKSESECRGGAERLLWPLSHSLHVKLQWREPTDGTEATDRLPPRIHGWQLALGSRSLSWIGGAQQVGNHQPNRSQQQLMCARNSPHCNHGSCQRPPSQHQSLYSSSSSSSSNDAFAI
nr:unnamed protein product [Digitaria exilis]